MGLPARSPISDRFQGTIYMTFGCSRSPVTVAVPNSSRSILAADDFGPVPGPAGAALPTDARAACARPEDGAGVTGLGLCARLSWFYGRCRRGRRLLRQRLTRHGATQGH